MWVIGQEISSLQILRSNFPFSVLDRPFFSQLQGAVISPMPNPQPGGPGAVIFQASQPRLTGKVDPPPPPPPPLQHSPLGHQATNLYITDSIVSSENPRRYVARRFSLNRVGFRPRYSRCKDRTVLDLGCVRLTVFRNTNKRNSC